MTDGRPMCPEDGTGQESESTRCDVSRLPLGDRDNTHPIAGAETATSQGHRVLCSECYDVMAGALGRGVEVLTIGYIAPRPCRACSKVVRGSEANAVRVNEVTRAADKLGLLRLECERAILKAEAR